MSDIENKRGLLLQAYPLSKSWQSRVKKMSDQQVIAVYLRLQAKGQLKKL